MLAGRLTAVRRGGMSALGAGLLLALALLAPAQATAQDYLLSPSDRVRIRVIEWRSGQGEWVEWAALGGEYTVSPAGSLLLPLVGDIRAEGRTPSQLAAAIGAELQGRAGLAARPDASVEIVQFRPVYVLGEVERPGEFVFRPGLTVIQAVTLAGGRYRMAEPGLVRLERDWISATGTFEAARQERRRLLVRQARISAELAESQEIALPAELRDDPDVATLLADERAILQSRQQAAASALTGLRNLQTLFEREVVSLGQKIDTQRRQVELAQRELRDVTSLRQQGLAAAARVSGLERVVADLESRLLDFDTAMLRARQEAGRVEREASDLLTRRLADAAIDMQQVAAQLEQVTVRLATSRSLMNEAVVTGPGLMAGRQDRFGAPLVFSILRRVNGQPMEMAAEETTPLLPGDVVRVGMGVGPADAAGRTTGSLSAPTIPALPQSTPIAGREGVQSVR